MYEVKLSEKAYEKLENFVESYKSIFEKLYEDTWLENIDEIVDLYYISAIALKNTFLHLVEKSLKQEVVACVGDKIIPFYKGYRLEIFYSEIENTRIVENINISHK